MTSDDPLELPTEFSTIDEWILSRLARMVETVNDELDKKNFSKAVRAIKEFVYYEFCDYYLVRLIQCLFFLKKYFIIKIKKIFRKELSRDLKVNN